MPDEAQAHHDDPTADQLLATLENLLAIQATDLRGALSEAADLLAGVLGADKVDVFLLDPASQTLVALGISDTPLGRHEQAIGMDRLQLANGGRAVEVFQTGIPYRHDRRDSDPGELRGITEGLRVRSAVAVPLAVGGERRGVLQADALAPEHFTERDVAFLEAVSRWLGLIAQRTELVEQIAAQAAEQGRRAAADELITVLAHDLRNHLTPLRARLELMSRRVVREGRAQDERDLQEALGALDRLTRLITDLLDTARLDQGLFMLSPQLVDVVELVQATATVLRAPTTPIEVQAPEELCLLADPDRLRQALENLLSNALTHAPAAQPVRVEVAADGRAAGKWDTIRVIDREADIPREVQPRLFERFPTEPGSTGLGLGLYLAHQIAAAHGGTLSVETSPNGGTCFVLALPPQPRQPT